MVNQGKPSIFALIYDRQHGGHELAFADFDIANLQLDEVMSQRLYLSQSQPRDCSAEFKVKDQTAFVDIKIKGSLKQDNNQQDFTFSQELSETLLALNQSPVMKRTTIKGFDEKKDFTFPASGT